MSTPRTGWDRLFTVRSRVGSGRELFITREGRFYGLFTLGVGAAAINTGNNLLYLVLGLQLASIVISGILSEDAITGLQVQTIGARDGRAGEEGAWLLRVRRLRGRIPAFTLTLTSDDGPARGATASVLRLPVGAEETVELHFTPQRRGRFMARRMTLATRFPFGFFEKSRTLEVEQEIFVYPRRGSAALPATAPRVEVGERKTERPGRGPELLSLRPWAPGDALSQMHWKKSAQTGTLIAANREHEDAPAIEVRLSLRAQSEAEDLARLEHELERAAATVERALDRGCGVALVLGASRTFAPADSTGRRRVLRALAAAEPELAP